MKRASRIAVGAAIVGVVTALAVFWPGAAQTGSRPANNVLAHALDVALGQAEAAQFEQDISGAALRTVLEASGHVDEIANAQAGIENVHASGPSKTGTQGCQNKFVNGNIVNIRVNQDCGLRRQAEEVIAINPTNEANLIAGQNDSRNGFNQCGYDWSFDGGKTWGDQVPPFYQFLQEDGATADACSDPTATFDSKGNAYVAGILFNVNFPASSLIVMKSNAGIGGSFYHSPLVQPFQTYRNVPVGDVASDNDPDIFHDKEFIVADANAGSPKADNVYATWTRFTNNTGSGVNSNSPIYFSQSTDGGATWSPGIEISGAAPVCTVFSGSPNPNQCDQDQGSHPIVGPDGTIYVAFGNGNTPLVGINQVLFVKCPAAADCSNPASWSAPVKVNDLIGTHPIALVPNVPGCPLGRQCLPPNGYRVPEFTSITTSVDSHSNLYVSWSDFRNGDDPGSTCGPLLEFSAATPPCNNDVFYSASTDGGATWSAARNLTAGGHFGQTAQWQPWSAVTPDGGVLWAAYYDRQYGDCETTGCNDITLTRVGNPSGAAPSVSHLRITTSSMPNLTTVTNPVQAGFLGDYMWVATNKAGRPYVVWGDTRGLNGAIEEDIYFYRPGL
jgi:hypothetical protein